ncbi:hypothetical protein [Nonomuraea glycinis]|uniref:hypothetical protein n=1 Tax=Nonomuraea glycinis TaxID=2047744 RepID=UPI002E153CDD|nr:hypothetical protein OHA68_13230 [Nonomuraea glycinis]
MRGRILGVTALLALALAGCGSGATGGADVASAGDVTPTSGSSAAPSLGREERTLKWAQCMRENGVDVPDPKAGQGIKMTMGPGSEATMDKAQQACKEWKPSGGDGPGGARDGERMRTLAKCMRDNGVAEFPDPEGNTMRLDKKVADDPDFPAAQKKCQFDLGGS